MKRGRGGNPLALRHHKIREAEKDLAFALVKLQDGKLEAALLNVALATIRISGAMNEKEFELVFAELDRLTSRRESLPEIPDL